MNFEKIIGLLDKLSNTTKRLEMTEILSRFLKNVNCEEIGTISLLIMGKVFPSNNHQELKIANNIMINALSLSSGKSRNKVLQLWKDTGDLGLTARELIKYKQQVNLFNNELTLKEVIKTIKKLPEITGKGSTDLKLKNISRLLNNSTPKGAMYLTRLILGSMRTGASKGVLRDALSKVFDIDKKKIEQAYNLCTNYSLVAKEICKNPKNIKNFKLTLFNPINLMLYQKVKSVLEGFKVVGKPAILEIKYDGIRAQIHKNKDNIKIFTRNLDDITKQFPDAIKYVKKNIIGESVIFECEMVAYDKKKDIPLEFQQISRRIKRKYDIEEIEKKIPIKMFCFDLLMYNDKSYLNRSFQDRHNKLKSILKKNNNILMVKGIKTSSEEEAKKLFLEGIKNQEGIMFKNINSIYQAGSRVGYGVKLKSHMKELDLVIIEAYYGKGKRKDWFGSFTLACLDENTNEFLTIGKIGTGFSDKDLKKLNKLVRKNIKEEKEQKVILYPKIVVEVEYEEIQKSPTYSSGYALRFPRMVRFREDKKEYETNSLKMIEELIK